jgi:hypothetical protein
MIHYHGTPLTPRAELYKMAGKHFCVSFAHPSDAGVCLQIGQSIMWDNGAFSVYTKGKKFEPYKFYKWLEDKLGHPHWAVIPDVIDGDEQQQKDLLKTWPFHISLGAPVWHMGMSLDYLQFLCEKYPKVCFGSSGKYWEVGSDVWCGRADKAFNRIVQNNYVPHIHMLRGLAQAGRRWPFASADSVNVARNFKDKPQCPEKMARKIDSIQTPVSWQSQPEQMEWC